MKSMKDIKETLNFQSSTFLVFCFGIKVPLKLKSYIKTQRKVVSLFRDFLEGFSPPHLPDCLQNAITFFLFGLCWVWKSMLDKSIHFVCFPKKNLSLSVSHHFHPLFSKNWVFFAKNYVYWWETDKLQKFFFKWKVWMF